MEIFFARVFGIYFLIAGCLILFRKKSIMPAMSDLVKNKPLILTIGFVELLAGLMVVVAYPNISMTLPGILSFVGWLMIVESLLYLALPQKNVREFFQSFNTSLWYTAGSFSAIVLGLYLAGAGFGMW